MRYIMNSFIGMIVYPRGLSLKNIYKMKLCKVHHKKVFPIGNEHHWRMDDILINKMVYGRIFIKIRFIVYQ